MYFCLSLLKDQCLSIKKDIQQHLKEYILKELNLFQFDFKDIAELYPSLNYADCPQTKRWDDISIFEWSIVHVVKKQRFCL